MYLQSNHTTLSNSSALIYQPAQFKDGKDAIIDYYVEKPGCTKLVRKKIRLNRLKKKLNSTEFKKHTRKVVKELNEKLAYGWNPFIEQEAPKSFTSLSDALDTFISVKERDWSENSLRTYKSFAKTLKTYCKNILRNPDILMVNFDQQAAKEFMKYKWLEERISPKTFNNYKKSYHAIWTWLVEYNYAKANIFDGISTKRLKQKSRKEIPTEIRKQIKDELLSNNETAYWLMCELAFYGLIRPVEITRIKTKNVSIDKQIIVLDGSETKNGKIRTSSMPKHLIRPLAEQLKKSKGKYLFSNSPDFRPGDVQLQSRRIAKKWSSLRNNLQIDKDIQFYSQRDSGIIYMLESGVNPEFVRQQADHYSLEITTAYTNHSRPNGIQKIKDIAPEDK